MHTEYLQIVSYLSFTYTKTSQVAVDRLMKSHKLTLLDTQSTTVQLLILILCMWHSVLPDSDSLVFACTVHCS